MSEVKETLIAVNTRRENRRMWHHLSWYGVTYIGLLFVALVLRLWGLDTQALHHDESLHAVYSWYLYDGSGYVHDPMMHGPFQYISTAGIYSLFSDNNMTTRLLPALFGTLLVAVPYLLRIQLGRYGALATSMMITFSPTLLYYSRFARNDIYMAVWTLALIAFIWRYLATRQVRYLLFSAVVLSLAFATKETTYLTVAILSFFLVFYAIGDVVPWLCGKKALRRFSPAGDVLVLLVTLSLPVSAAIIALFQSNLGLTLANPDWKIAAVGIPLGSGLYVAFFTTLAFLGVAVVVGLRWRRRVWLVSFVAFYTIWLLLYTTFFTNFWGGLGSGIWQGLGYWIAQQEVARGSQPWYYYIVVGLTYEYMPILFGTIALIVYSIKGDAFSRFLAYWAVATFATYTFASEKMPWLMVGVALPFIVLAGKYVGELLGRIIWTPVVDDTDEVWPPSQVDRQFKWQVAAPNKNVFLAAISIFLLLGFGFWLLALVVSADSIFNLKLVIVLVIAVAFSGVLLFLSRIDMGRRWALVGFSIALALFMFNFPSAFRAAYVNSDIPVELLVYTQSSPEIPQIMGEIERLGDETGKGRSLKIIVDTTDGFSWPWVWYLRGYPSVSHLCLSEDSNCSKIESPPDADVVLLAQRSNAGIGEFMGEFGDSVEYKHRWWFPESYRGITPGNFLEGIQTRDSWCRVVRYFVDRGFGQEIGSSDGSAYFSSDFKPSVASAEINPSRIHC